jgi:hypothetical protein
MLSSDVLLPNLVAVITTDLLIPTKVGASYSSFDIQFKAVALD